MAGANYNDRDARWAKRYRLGRPTNGSNVVNVTVPDDVVRLSEHEPC